MSQNGGRYRKYVEICPCITNRTVQTIFGGNMKTINETELAILNKSLMQFSHFIKTTYQIQNANLIGRDLLISAKDTTSSETPSTTDLNNILNNAVKAPGTTSIAAAPNTLDSAMYQMLSQVQTLDAYISLLTSFCIYNEHPTVYDISVPQQASAFVRAMAKWRNYVITGGAVKAMAGYLPVNSIVTQNYSKELTSADLHLEFLSELFAGFGFPEATLIELDSILTKVVQKIGELKLSFETQRDTLDHFLTYYYFATVHGTGGKDQPPAMYVCKVRTFYLNVDQNSWKASVGKSTVSHFKFNMNYYDMDTTMNSGLVSTDMDIINSTIRTLTSKTEAEVKKLMNMQAVHADPQKG